MQVKVSDIIHETGSFWVAKQRELYFVMKTGVTHSESIGECAWKDKSLAIAYCNYQAKRGTKQ